MAKRKLKLVGKLRKIRLAQAKAQRALRLAMKAAGGAAWGTKRRR